MSDNIRRVLVATMFLLPIGRAGGGGEPQAAPGSLPGQEARPASVDLRPLLAAWGLGPRLQEERNTCSAFVVAEALEFALARKQGTGTRLSVEFLNWASNRAVGSGEDGGFFSELWKGFEAYGICPERDMPYLPAFSPAIEPSKEALEGARAALRHGLRLHWIKEWDPSKGLADGQLEEVRRTLARGWPVGGGFLWPKEESWDGDVLRICPRADVRDGHSVLLVGYRDDPAQPGGGLVIIRNTSREGRDGFLTYEYLRTYMNDAVWIDEVVLAAIPPFADPVSLFGLPPAGCSRWDLLRLPVEHLEFQSRFFRNWPFADFWIL